VTDYRLSVYPAAAARAADPARPSVAIVILNWNARAHLAECLDALRGLSYAPAYTVVVDQGSRDGSAELVRAQYPEVTLLALDRNLEFCRGNNVGIDWALDQGVDYVFVLNNDTVVMPDTLERLVAAAEADPALGIVAPRSLRYHDPEIVDLGVRITWWHGGLHNIRPSEVPPGTVELSCDYAWGCALLIRRAVLERIGGFSPDWNLYHEDADLCLRARRAGYRTATRLDATIRHKLGASTTSVGRFVRHFYFRVRNLVRLVLAHAPPGERLIFLALLAVYVVPRQALVHALALWRGRRAPAGRPRFAPVTRRP
jgi:GT2 family glycosyltransferase